MAHQQDDSVLATVMQLLIENGFDGLADSFRILVNEAMKVERSQALQAQPHQRTPDRLGYANGFKDKTVATRLGAIPLKVPQVRGGVEFYPSSLERGRRSASLRSGASKTSRRSAATSPRIATLGTCACALRCRWHWQRCHDTPGRRALRAARRPA